MGRSAAGDLTAQANSAMAAPTGERRRAGRSDDDAERCGCHCDRRRRAAHMRGARRWNLHVLGLRLARDSSATAQDPVVTSPTGPPTDPMWGTPVVSISAGDYFTCVTDRDGNFACFGSDSAGQMGDGYDPDNGTPVQSPERILVNEGETVLLATGAAHACIVMYTFGLNDILRCWGSDSLGSAGQRWSQPERWRLGRPAAVASRRTGADAPAGSTCRP